MHPENEEVIDVINDEATTTTTSEAVDSGVDGEVLSEPTVELTGVDLLNEMIQQSSGSFPVKINHANLKYVRNKLHDKTEWTGPDEAYMMAMTLINLDQALAGLDAKSHNPIEVHLPSAVIRSVDYFLRKVTGTGMEAAQRIFAVAMMFRPATERISNLNRQIEQLKKEIDSTTKSEVA
jgi:hypothetical protein